MIIVLEYEYAALVIIMTYVIRRYITYLAVPLKWGLLSTLSLVKHLLLKVVKVPPSSLSGPLLGTYP